MSGVAKFAYALGEARRAWFRLRSLRTGGPLNVNDATAVYLAPTRVLDGAELPPIYAVRESGLDDWLGGLVTMVLGPHNITAVPGTYTFALRVTFADEEPVFTDIRADVSVGVRLEPYLIPGIGSFTGGAEVAIAGGNIVFGEPVVGTVVEGRTTIVPATAELAAVDGAILGVALSPATAGYGATWSAETLSVKMADWTTVAPTQQLLANTIYYLDTAGRISPTGTGPVVGTSDATGRSLVR